MESEVPLYGESKTPGFVVRNFSSYGIVGGVWLEWQAPIAPGVSGYIVHMSSDGGLTWGEISFSNNVDPVGGGSGSVLNLDPAKTYCFRVRAVGSPRLGPWSSLVCLKPKSGPAAPTNVRAFSYFSYKSLGVFSPNRIFVDWDAPSSDMPITGYIVDMKEGNQDWGANPTNYGSVVYEPAAIVSGSATLAEDILRRYASDDSVRLFRVKADTGGGYGPWSDPVAVSDGLGMSPSHLDWSYSSGNITISWSAPTQTNGYVLSGYAVSLVGNNGATYWENVEGTSVSAPIASTPYYASINLRAKYLGAPDVDADYSSSRSQVSISSSTR